jgi:hypothetical protein
MADSSIENSPGAKHGLMQLLSRLRDVGYNSSSEVRFIYNGAVLVKNRQQL